LQGAPGPAPTTIGASTDGSATNSSSEKKTLTAAGLVWVFYTDGCNIVYQTSADGGRTWSASPTVARTGISRGWFFTVAQNGSTLYFVVSASDGSTNGIAFRSGTMKSDGTISWSTAEQDVPYSVGSATVPTVALDTSGNVWTAIETLAGSGRHIEVFRTTGGAWSRVFDVGGLADYPRPILLQLASGKMALEILTETPGERHVVIYTTANGGATWSSPVTTPPDNIFTLSSVSVGDTVYSVTSDTSGNVYLWTYAYGSSAFAGPTALAKCCYNDATISTDGASLLFVAYSSSSSVLYETSKDVGASWTPPAAIATAENQIQLGSLATNSLTSGLVSVVWTAQNSGGSPLFDVRFDSVTY
jgi:Neuraminidase (sialidase)